MFIGFLISLVCCGPLAYYLTHVAVKWEFESKHPFWGALVLFLAQLIGLSLVSTGLLLVWTFMGFSGSLALGAISHAFDIAHPGLVAAIGSIIVAAWGFFGFLAGPASAFVVAKIMGITNLVTSLCKLDEKRSLSYLPIASAVVATFTMWPFTAFLTFGL